MINEHEPEQPVVILVLGVPGAGKSTVARALAERLERAACIEGDLVQHHFTVTGLVGPGELPWLVGPRKPYIGVSSRRPGLVIVPAGQAGRLR